MANGVRFVLEGVNRYFIPAAWQAKENRINDAAQRIFNGLNISSPFIVYSLTTRFISLQLFSPEYYVALAVVAASSKMILWLYTKLQCNAIKKELDNAQADIDTRASSIYAKTLEFFHFDFSSYAGIGLFFMVVAVIEQPRSLHSLVYLFISISYLRASYKSYQESTDLENRSTEFKENLKFGLDESTEGNLINHWKFCLDHGNLAIFKKEALGKLQKDYRDTTAALVSNTTNLENREHSVHADSESTSPEELP